MCKKCEQMARRKRKTTRRRTKRRTPKRGMFGVGKTGSIPTNQILAIGAGAVAAKVSDKLMLKIPVKAIQDNPMLRDGIKAGLGIFMAMQKDAMVANAGLGMAGYAIAKAVGGFLPADYNDSISGVGRYQLGTGPAMMGLGMQSNYSALSGVSRWDGVGTEPDMLMGFDDEELVA